MSDLLVNVRQIGNYPLRAQSDGGELLLVQVDGLGTPYASMTAAGLVSTALEDGGPLSVGVSPPDHADGSQAFLQHVVLPNDGNIFWNAFYDDTETLRYWQTGRAGNIELDNNDGFIFEVFTPGIAGREINVDAPSAEMHFGPDGNLTLFQGTVTVAQNAQSGSMQAVPMAQLETLLNTIVDWEIGELTGLLHTSGGIMTGPLILHGPGVGPNEAVTVSQLAAAGGRFPIALIPPANPASGQPWVDAATGMLYCWFTDPDSAQWVSLSAPGGGGGDATTIAGRPVAAGVVADEGAVLVVQDGVWTPIVPPQGPNRWGQTGLTWGQDGLRWGR